MEIEGFRGVALVEEGGEAFTVARGTTGDVSDWPITTDTRFQLASVSKHFTATAALLMVDRGKLALQESITTWIDDLPSEWRPITLHQLLTHTSGLGHWRDFPDLSLSQPCALERVRQQFEGGRLLSVPGERYSYSSPGYWMIAYLVQSADGRPYANFLDQEIFTPLGMGHTFAGNGNGAPELAAPLSEGKPIDDAFELDTVGMGAGDAWSTVHDMVRFDRALLSGKILSESSRRAMLTVQTSFEERRDVEDIRGYGYGFYIGRTGEHEVIFHTGDNAGFRAINGWFADRELVYVALSNEYSTDISVVAQAMRERFLSR